MRSIFLILIFLCEALYAQKNVIQTELAGFVLGQYRSVVHRQLGLPIRTIDMKDGWIYEFHRFKSDTSVYGLFKYASSDSLRIKSIQINGARYDDMHPFFGLKLGDAEDRVNQILGSPSAVDTLVEPGVSIQYYHRTNYLVKIDAKKTLSGIQIDDEYEGVSSRPVLASLSSFRNAILTGNVDSLMNTICPDAEIYSKGETVSFSGAMRDEFMRRDSRFVNLLIGKEGSVKSVLKKEKIKPVLEMRLYTEGNLGSATVFKFNTSKILAEIVFVRHAQQWKVYEILFK